MKKMFLLIPLVLALAACSAETDRGKLCKFFHSCDTGEE